MTASIEQARRIAQVSADDRRRPMMILNVNMLRPTYIVRDYDAAETMPRLVEVVKPRVLDDLIAAMRCLYQAWEGTEGAQEVLDDTVRTIGHRMFGMQGPDLNGLIEECMEEPE